MGIFRGRKTRTDGGAVISDRNASKSDLDALREFAESRKGVEGYIEPKTSVTQTTLLLVAADGESLRRRVSSAQAAADFARKKLGIPVYDANLVGIPSRKRDYDLRKAKGTEATKPSAPAPAKQTPKELAAIMTLESIAGVDPLPTNPSFDELMVVYRKARKQAHPDRLDGARTKWDKVEDAARALGLPD
ncbi:hypothetical protein [Aeromicrobium sp.]|uniref:hypothetical protein n=1 Tax=Aeromicrobium sp. TaxID=1871063 RepID=UPI002FC9AD20